VGSLSIWHWLIVLVIVAFVFGGRGKLSGIMGDAAKGIRAFREGLKGEEEEAAVEPPPAQPLPKTRAKTKANG
jgi:sec-independent protein translocase protein TatA